MVIPEKNMAFDKEIFVSAAYFENISKVIPIMALKLINENNSELFSAFIPNLVKTSKTLGNFTSNG